jgi:hypothetical protein
LEIKEKTAALARYITDNATMNSKDNYSFLLSLTISGAGNADFIVSSQVKNSIGNFTNVKGCTK